MIETNLNYCIKVRLTDTGQKVYQEYCLRTGDLPYLRVDADGYTEFQLWHFMYIFGGAFRLGDDVPCETKVFIATDDK